MSIFEWSDDYAVDEGMIDDQHKYLLHVSEQLFNAVIEQADAETLNGCFQKLLSYTQKHFEDEEEFFQDANPQSLALHKSEHQELAKELLQVWEDEKTKKTDEPGRVLLNWVEERLIPHMMIDDQQTFNSLEH